MPVAIKLTRRGRLTVFISAGAVAVIALVVGIALAMSGGKSGVPWSSSYQTPAPEVIAPLTGKVTTADKINNPAMSVKICNVEDCEPEIGLNQADIVFEEIVEGGISRYVSVWQSDIPETVGPVRSVRPMDGDIAAPFGGILVYSGYGAEETHQIALQSGLVNVTENNPNMYRLGGGRVAPYNLALHAQQVIKENPGPAPAQQFAYSSGVETSTAAVDGGPAQNIKIAMSGSSQNQWQYDAASGKFLRWQWGGPDKDADGKQLASTNVAVMRVNVEQFVGVPRTIMIGSGEAYVATGGKVVHGKWTKAGTKDPIVFTDDNGVTIRMAPGNTWIELVPTGGYVVPGSATFSG